ncbi:YjbF family lipoprotein [Puniceibacterium confluentis]|nr:YjbF family lipoprotein [Puniceibacterium confluentis]
MKKSLVILACAVLLSACSSNGTGQPPPLVRQALGAILSRQQVTDLRQTITPQFVADLDQPALFVELPDRGAQAGAVLVQDHDRRRIWATRDGVTLTLVSGVLTESRGLGGDLMSTDLSEAGLALGGEVESAVRIHRYLTGDNSLDAMAFVCNYRRQDRVPVVTLTGSFMAKYVSEDCVGPDIRFENRYWMTSTGAPLKSIQWVGPDIGYALIEHLRD